MNSILKLKLYLITVIIMTCQSLMVNCYTSGAPSESCDTLLLNSSYHGAQEQTSGVPFEIDTSVFRNPFSGELHYIPNSTYRSKLSSPVKLLVAIIQSTVQNFILFPVTLRPKRCSMTFQGFVIQARLADDNSTVVGSFAAPSLGDNYQLSSCAIQEVSMTRRSQH